MPSTPDLRQCAECGHLHFDAENRVYVDCPLRPEGCLCAGQDDDGAPLHVFKSGQTLIWEREFGGPIAVVYRQQTDAGDTAHVTLIWAGTISVAPLSALRAITPTVLQRAVDLCVETGADATDAILTAEFEEAHNLITIDAGEPVDELRRRLPLTAPVDPDAAVAAWRML